MDAEKARRVTDAVLEYNAKQSMLKTMDQIKRACEEGMYETFIDYGVPDSVKKQLQDMGYATEDKTTPYFYGTTISWRSE